MITLKPLSYRINRLEGQFEGRPYHVVRLQTRWRWEEMIRDLDAAARHSDTDLDADKGSDQAGATDLLAQLAEGVWCESRVNDDVLEVAATSRKVAREWMDKLRSRYEAPCPTKEHPPQLRILAMNSMGEIDDRGTPVDPRWLLNAETLGLHYGTDFVPWHGALIKELHARPSGLFLLRGEPGTGKTSFIRHLISMLRESHRCFFIPSYAARAMTEPGFTSFWLRQDERHAEKRLLIFEDAEDLLAPRGGGNSSEVSNLLNLADGLMGDALKFQIVATVNRKLEELDAAVRRPGRLFAYREFRRLTAEEASRLAATRGLRAPAGQEDYSLAEIYDRCLGDPSGTPRPLGFQQAMPAPQHAMPSVMPVLAPMSKQEAMGAYKPS